MPEGRTILKIGAEGGGLSMLARRGSDGRPEFAVYRNESALYDLLSEEDREGLEPTSTSDWIDSFEQALARLDRYPWPWLYPLAIDPEYADPVLAAVRHRFAARPGRQADSDYERWERVAAGESSRY